MKMRATSRAQDKKPAGNNRLGRALKFYSSVRLDVRRVESVKQGGEIIANKTKVKVVKNKVAPPFKEAVFDIVFGQGIDTIGEIIDMSSDAGIIEKSGAWYAYGGTKIGQGRENTKTFLRNNPEMAKEIKDKLLSKLYGEAAE